MDVKNGDFAAAVQRSQSAGSNAAKAEGHAHQRRPHLHPNPNASQRYPVQPFQRAIPMPRAWWRTALDMALWLVVIVCGVLLAVLYLSPDAKRLASVSDLRSDVWLVLMGVGMALSFSFQWKGGRVRMELAHDPHGLAEIPGFCGTDCLYLRQYTEIDETDEQHAEALDFLPRADGAKPPPGGPHISARRDCELSIDELKFTDRQPVPRRPGALPASQAALLIFAAEIERALGWPAGKVWVLEAPLTDEEDTGGIWCSILIQGGQTVATETLCDAIVQARDAVLTRYTCEEL